MQNLFRYDGQRVLVCGCYSGMGEATAQIVRSLGAEVVAVDVKKPSFDFSSYLEVDLRDSKAIEQMVAAVAKGGRIDRLFYCAGLPGTKPAVDVMGVNFIGLRHTAEQCVPHLPRNGGAIASISSAAGMAYLMMMEQGGRSARHEHAGRGARVGHEESAGALVRVVQLLEDVHDRVDLPARRDAHARDAASGSTASAPARRTRR